MLCMLPFHPTCLAMRHCIRRNKVPSTENAELLMAILLKSAISQNVTSLALPAAKKCTFLDHSTSFFPNPLPTFYPHWGTAEAEIKVVKNPELKDPPFKA